MLRVFSNTKLIEDAGREANKGRMNQAVRPTLHAMRVLYVMN